MPISVVLNTVASAEVQQSLRSGASRIVQTGLVKGLTSTTTTSKMALWDALHNAGIALPALGDSFDASIPNYRLMHRASRGVPDTSGTMAHIWLHYEKLGGGGTPIERFAAEDSVTLVSEPTNVLPGTAQQLLCSVTSEPPEYADSAASPDDRPITANYPRTMRSLVLYGLFADQPPAAVLNAANTVNSAAWQGLPTGRWRCEGARARYSSRDGMYAVSVGFLSKGAGLGEDWSTYEVPRDPNGQLVKVSSTKLTNLYAQPYAYGIRSDKDAIWKAGLYQTANFGAIFGVSFPIGD